MSEQPPVQPPSTPPQQPSGQPPQGNPPTQPMAAAYSSPPAGPAVATTPDYRPGGGWRQITSTSGGRLALALSAAAVVLLLVMGVAVTSFLVLRNHDRVNLLGDRQSARSFGQYGPGNGRGLGHGNGKAPGADGGKNGRNVPGLPGQPGGRVQGLPGLENLLGGTALHGDVTANAGGSVQSLVFQRGEVTAVSGTSVTLKSSDGFTATYGLNATTRSRGATLAKGGQAFVLARASDKVAIATLPMSGTVGQAPSS
ncbi:MAG: hypothetical protein ABI662_04725 [Dermatophilaceae bacterium]